MRVVLSWLLVRQEYTGMVIEFDKNDRALDTEVERVVFAETSDPAKVGLAQVLSDLIELVLARLRGMI